MKSNEIINKAKNFVQSRKEYEKTKYETKEQLFNIIKNERLFSYSDWIATLASDNRIMCLYPETDCLPEFFSHLMEGELEVCITEGIYLVKRKREIESIHILFYSHLPDEERIKFMKEVGIKPTIVTFPIESYNDYRHKLEIKKQAMEHYSF